MLKDATRYRYGNRDDAARCAHVDEENARRRELLAAAHPAWLRRALLEAIRDGVSPREAAERLRTSFQAIYALARIDPEWGRELDEATSAACTCEGTGWKRQEPRKRCHCPIARAYRAEESRRERAQNP
ncbi:hypothetical protein ACIBCT_35240 [Streptosporangium sp. NPDC050855]|uniref:hypothetical protein n=1 Tax=Streptosporangium sp. NPDC050855 TaxID=3366194 RepID=UPI0037A69336